MTNQEKLALIEETLEMDEGTLTEDTVLADLDEYTSMAKLSLLRRGRYALHLHSSSNQLSW